MHYSDEQYKEKDMPNPINRICFDRIIPQEYTSIAREIAIDENPANASPFEAAAVRSKLWKSGRPLRIAFLGGLPEVQRKVMYHAQLWCQFANISFVQVNHLDAEIRISFEEGGSWSAVGTDALVKEYFPKDGPTMNFGWLTPASSNNDYSSVVLHEFGHALGMIHEHQSPTSSIQWNKAIVVNALSGPPNYWDEAMIQFNVFDRYSITQTQFTQFDPASIMLYSFPKEWTLNNMAFPSNSTLSQNDKNFISARYPH